MTKFPLSNFFSKPSINWELRGFCLQSNSLEPEANYLFATSAKNQARHEVCLCHVVQRVLVFHLSLNCQRSSSTGWCKIAVRFQSGCHMRRRHFRICFAVSAWLSRDAALSSVQERWEVQLGVLRLELLLRQTFQWHAEATHFSVSIATPYILFPLSVTGRGQVPHPYKHFRSVSLPPQHKTTDTRFTKYLQCHRYMEVLASKPHPVVGHFDSFSWLSLLTPGRFKDNTTVRTKPLPSRSFPCHNPSIILSHATYTAVTYHTTGVPKCQSTGD